jgi:DNA-binding NtrC family response regulator
MGDAPSIDSAKSQTVLIADDDPVTRKLVDHHLREAGFQTRLAADGDEAVARLDSSLSAAIFDLQMPRRNGLDCLKFAREQFPDLPVLIISQVGEIRDAVNAIKQGAFEFISKPIDPDELLARLRQAKHTAELSSENRQLRQAVQSPAIAAELIGASTFTQWLQERVGKMAQLDATVLITGESGTGKTTVARMIHNLGPRRQGPFVAVSCAALPRDLVEAELFGHVRGAFTGALNDRPGRAEMAHGGTLFLDEIGDLPLELQPKLLAFLQDRTVQRIGAIDSKIVDVRVIAATHVDIKSRSEKGLFRQDLFFRLAVLTLPMLPLRDRRDDVVPLAQHVLARIAEKRGGKAYHLVEEAARSLVEYAWPGNIRELENILERATAFCEDHQLELADLGLEGCNPTDLPPPQSLAGMTLAEIERRALIETLRHLSGNKKAAARMLGIDEKSVYNKMRRLDIRNIK